MSATVALQTENLGKIYGRGKKRVRAVKNLNLHVEEGQVYGFLGPNGAGKSTTIRMMMDLVHPTQGDVYIYGQHVRREHDTLRRVGAIVEGALFYSFLSGRTNLEVIAHAGNYYDAHRITALLEQVGLAGHADKYVKGYSTGMKQRLGLAAALLNNPDLLILDEPTNGLDPGGIQEMRLLIRELVEKHGKTVFFSSHILAEVEQVCDRVAIINQGEIVREGKVADLLAESSQVRVEAAPLDRAADALRTHWTLSVNTQALLVNAAHGDIPHMVRRLVEHGVDVYHVGSQRQTLEDYFLSVTQQSAPPQEEQA